MIELHTLDELKRHVDDVGTLDCVAVQQVDVSSIEGRLRELDAAGALFLGCAMSPALQTHLQEAGGLVMRAFPDLSFEPFRARLYTRHELFDRFDPARPQSYCACFDAQVYAYWQRTGASTPPFITDAVFRGMHDQSISDALHDYLRAQDRPVVAIMGGHSLARGAPRYRDVAQIARQLTQQGTLMVSGGGPGAMEATHLGALTASCDEAVLTEAIDHLATAPSYRHERWLATAFEVLEELKSAAPLGESVGLPTWHYGHEPPTPFASHIAKYFANSLREAGLLTIAHAGIVFAPGSAGTIQEVFQDAAQNHYAAAGRVSPMVFLDEAYWRTEAPVYPLLEELARGASYHDLMRLADTAEGVLDALDTLDPVPAASHAWSFCEAYGDAQPGGA